MVLDEIDTRIRTEQITLSNQTVLKMFNMVFLCGHFFLFLILFCSSS